MSEAVNSSLPPLLCRLAKLREQCAISSSPPFLIRGEEVMKSIGTYQKLLDFVPSSPTPALSEPIGERLPLTHAQLRDFLLNDFDLLRFNVPRGGRVALLLPNGPELALCVVSVISQWCAAPVNPTNTWEEIKGELESCGVCAIIILAGSSNESALKAAEHLSLGVLVLTPSGATTGLFRLVSLVSVPKTKRIAGYTFPKTVEGFTTYSHPEAVLLLHTSGTSGTKKLVAYSLDTLLCGVGSIICSWNLSPADVCLNMMPLFHIGGLIRNVFSPLLSGGCVIACAGFDPILFWNVLSVQRVTWYYAAPTMHHAILLEAERREAPLPVQDIRYIANAAGGLLPVLAIALSNQSLPKSHYIVHHGFRNFSLSTSVGDTFKATILTSYGMTECMPISSPPQSYNLSPAGTSGVPVGPDVIIVDDNFKRLGPFQTGSILVRGAPCFGGYENSQSATDESFLTVEEVAGWFNTGDMGYMDENSYLFISGRSKEIINRGGETISPFEIEEAVVQHPLVKETLAFVIPHATFQESIGVVIVPYADKPRVDLPSLWKYIDSKLHRSKWPQLIVYMNALPKNAAGKTLRIHLGERFQLKEIDEDSPPVSRLLEATCPPVGASLKEIIPSSKVTADVSRVDSLLRRQSGIKFAKALLVDLPFKPQSIVAFVCADGSAAKNEASLLEICSQNLHSYDNPLFIHFLDMPMSSQDKSSLNDVVYLSDIAQRIYLERNLVAPRNPMEKRIEKIWRQFLGSPSMVSVVESFFDMGGDSLKAGQLVNIMRKSLKIQISVADLFTSPSIESMALKMSKLKIIGSPNLSAKVLGSDPSAYSSSNHDTSPLVSEISPRQAAMEAEKKWGGSWEHSTNLSNTSWPCLVFQLVPIRKTKLCFTISVYEFTVFCGLYSIGASLSSHYHLVYDCYSLGKAHEPRGP